MPLTSVELDEELKSLRAGLLEEALEGIVALVLEGSDLLKVCFKCGRWRYCAVVLAELLENSCQLRGAGAVVSLSESEELDEVASKLLQLSIAVVKGEGLVRFFMPKSLMKPAFTLVCGGSSPEFERAEPLSFFEMDLMFGGGSGHY